MNIPDILGPVVDWIEGHEHTIDLTKWIAVGLAAWALGVFRAVREWTRRPSISVNLTYSRCYLDQHVVLGEYTDVALLVFVLDAEIMNPTGSRIGIRSFELQVKRTGLLKHWTRSVSAIGFPSMPSTPMPGGNIKLVPIWMTTFTDYDPSLTLKEVSQQDSAAGLVFFAVAVPTTMLPLTMTECPIKLRVTFGTGERRAVKATVNVHTDFEHLGRTIEGSIPYVRHDSVWVHRA